MNNSRHFLFALVLLILNLGEVAAAQKIDLSSYQLGHGVQLSDSLTVGAYVSSEYKSGDSIDEFAIDDVAVMFYGNASETVSYMVEFESVGFYVKDFKSDAESWTTKPRAERLYLDYKPSDFFAVRLGKQITPIGYWNLQPINVLRETTSNPQLSRVMFPKFLSGVDIYGFTPFNDQTQYHVYLQGTQDIDSQYVNINVDSHYGMSLEHRLNDTVSVGASVGRFRQVNDPSTTSYTLINARYRSENLNVFGEAIRNRTTSQGGVNDTAATAYLQAEYRFTPKHSIIGRTEFFDESNTKASENINVLGYSYRPIFPVSLKLEYQWHDNHEDNQFVSSIAVLF